MWVRFPACLENVKSGVSDTPKVVWRSGSAHCSRGRLVRVRFPAKSIFPTDRLTFWLARRRPTRNQVTVACASFRASVRFPHAESCAMLALSASRAEFRLWRWTISSGHLNAMCATPWGWPHLQCLYRNQALHVYNSKARKLGNEDLVQGP